jgi:extracellular elastinolytic metalloproteinase
MPHAKRTPRRPRPKKLTPAARSALLVKALVHANKKITPAMGAFVSTGGVHVTSTGATTVALRQEYAGIPVNNAVVMVRFTARGGFDGISGRPVPVPRGTIVVPRFSAVDAVHAVFLEMLNRGEIPEGLTFSSDRPEVVAQHSLPASMTVLRKEPFAEPILASLILDTTQQTDPLTWEVRLALPDGGRSYIAHVAAARGKAPAVRQLRRMSAHAAGGVVFDTDPRTPAGNRTFPLPRSSYPGFSGGPIPITAWVAADRTSGNNVECSDKDGTIAGQLVNGDLRFDAADPTSIQQCAINAFYLCNYLHDFFYLLGFTEAEGNFQQQNAAGGGVAGDPLRALVLDFGIDGFASYDNRPDGQKPTLRLGRHPSGHHTALDAHIVVHEFVHGVLNRVIGTSSVPAPLWQEESEALAEGFCDYFAITITNRLRRAASQPEEWSYATWLSGTLQPLRPFSYLGFPKTYGYLKTKKLKTHEAGQVWCAALLDLSRLIGETAAWQVVFDALKGLHPQPVGPTYLDARNAVIRAFDDYAVFDANLATTAMKKDVRAVFSDRGMGRLAESPEAKLKKVVEDFTPIP